MKRALLAILALCLSVDAAFAWFEAAKGGQPGAYLSELSGGARGFAMGLAQVADEGQTNLLYSNPASIAGIWWKEASFSFLPLFAQSQYASLSYACPVKGGNTLGVSLVRLASGDAEKTNALGETMGSFSEQQTAVTAAAATKLSKNVYCGAGLKMVSQDIDTLSTRSIGADAGIIYRYAPEHTWGLSVINAVPPVLGPDRFPQTMKAGFSHIFLTKLRWNAEISLLNIFGGESVNRWSSGFEYNRPDWFFWRLGANEKQFSAGFGIGSKQLDIDYAFIYHPLDTLHCISLNLRYGYPAEDAELRATQKIDDIKKEKQDYLETVKKENENLKFERERLNKEKALSIKFIEARKAFEEKNYSLAQSKVTEILVVDPTHEEARRLDSEIKARLSSEDITRRLQYARESYRKGAYSEAKRHADYVIGILPDNQEARVLGFLSNAQLYLSNKEFKEAKGELFEVLKIEPSNAEATQLLKRVQNILDAYGDQ